MIYIIFYNTKEAPVMFQLDEHGLLPSMMVNVDHVTKTGY